MKKGDRALFYHSNEGLEIVGIAEVIREHYQDPTTDDERWSVVDLKPVRALAKPVSLKQIKQDPRLQQMNLIRQMRLSVSAVTADEYHVILALGK